ncbi:hypothetical protein [Hoeflea olei]|uniref:Cobalt transporter n=1 Tax=Hoeflea olei TaxID=1480615 RepID=A0A1C1YU48_9HYPH|nr:hypothetical protein [Hoeflea olei]OCW57078.1 hypothetical protein AWJ14_07980 [Hoeflea olei]
MKRLWPGWLLCLATVGLVAHMVLVSVPEISALLGGLALPDTVPLGYDVTGAQALHAAFAADFAEAAAAGRQSASAAYVALHAGQDLAAPPLIAASLAFLAFASAFSGGTWVHPSRPGGIAIGLVLALAFSYLASDFLENAIADALFGPAAMQAGFNPSLAAVLKVMTIGKFATLILAGVLIAGLWGARWKRARA